MFLSSVNTAIDTIQGAKSTFVKTFVQDKGVAESLQSFVDSQTAFVKQVAKTTHDVVIESTKQVASFDASKVFNIKK